jgi:hypothetical protein
MGSAIALMEDCPTVPGTPENVTELQDELRELVGRLDALEVLLGFSHAIQATTQDGISNKMAYYLLHLSFPTRKISWEPFAWNESQRANAKYTELEQAVIGKNGEHVVLVKAGSLAAMKRSYPSFFLDTESFSRLVTTALTPGGLVPQTPLL